MRIDGYSKVGNFEDTEDAVDSEEDATSTELLVDVGGDELVKRLWEPEDDGDGS